MGLIEQGAVIEGSGLATPFRNAGAPTDEVTFAGKAAKGAALVDTTNGVVYVNTGTMALPTWTKVGTQT